MVRSAASCGFAHCACSLALPTARPDRPCDDPGGAIHGATGAT
jgi:hypothetical protein